MPYAHSLSDISLREEIVDTIVRACLGIDTNDKALWESAWATEDPDISLTSSGTALQGMENINKYCFDNVGLMDTYHLTTGIRIDVKDGANIAYMTANALNKHYAPGEGLQANEKHLLVGSKYDIQVIKVSVG
ncbi:uncharacterized protein TRUGW13939_11230 [Talaromyces rugulosus]|uniref:SnoaL-like domain-containing protein n=1 Tax=Talaromyces rugulosus TaxID=121627 RepID=A0A7H8RD92_TALRU|nr:uncharacterized protein TRUGW13939_11230 [Talaromyces rugulosus]QKX64057.1 hypothetical protein TRUGW13939_11230 [Talaromyces rugulosus]